MYKVHFGVRIKGITAICQDKHIVAEQLLMLPGETGYFMLSKR